MLTAGILMLLLAILGVYFYKSKKLEQQPWFMKLLLWSIPIPYIANISGWYMAEAGRQPWIVYGLQKSRRAYPLPFRRSQC